MRDVTKSIGSFSIALTVYGAQQTTDWVRRAASPEDHPAGAPAAPDGLETVSRTAQGELTGYFRNLYEAGDRLQRTWIDLGWGFLDGSAWEPRKALDLSATAVKDSVAAFAQLLPGSSTCRRPAGEPCGWGPMPPAR